MGRSSLVLGGVIALLGCVHPLHVDLKPQVRIGDKSAWSGAPASGGIGSVMLLPPRGSSRGEFGDILPAFERALLQRGLRVVSAAVTGRVVQERKAEAASQLTDIERALILSKETGADALLQVGAFEWQGTASRWFCEGDGDLLEECSEADYRAAARGREVSGEVARLTGRVIDGQTGEVLAIIALSIPVVDGLDCSIRSGANQEPKIVTRCGPCSEDSWWCRQCNAAAWRVLEDLADHLVANLAQRKSKAAAPAVQSSAGGSL